MRKSEMKKVLVIEKLLDGRMNNKEGALALGLSVRQVIRLKNKYREGGARSIVHGNRGRPSCRALRREDREAIRDLYVTKYHGSNCCHFTDLLQEHEGFEVSVSSVRRILREGGILPPERHRRPKQHRLRNRRSEAGMLWQIDATPYPWLGEEYGKFALHAAIDDATGIVTGATFRKNECMEGYFEIMAQGIREYGIPLGIYSDKHTIFRSPNEKLTLDQELAGETVPLSQFGKAMKELDIEHIKANTPQAKGRIERLWSTLQSRLVIELRLLGITTMDAADRALPGLLRKHNKRFAVPPASRDAAYREMEKTVKLEQIFSIRSFRKAGPGNSISYNGKLYVPSESSSCFLTPKTTVEVRETLSGEGLFWHEGKAIGTKIIDRPKAGRNMELNSQTEIEKKAKGHKPSAGHPWIGRKRKPAAPLYEQSSWDVLNYDPYSNIKLHGDIFNEQL